MKKYIVSVIEFLSFAYTHARMEDNYAWKVNFEVAKWVKALNTACRLASFDTDLFYCKYHMRNYLGFSVEEVIKDLCWHTDPMYANACVRHIFGFNYSVPGVF